jgi:hypothetical protein
LSTTPPPLHIHNSYASLKRAFHHSKDPSF